MGKVVGFYKKHGKTRPITESKGKKKSSYHGQTTEPSWKESSVRDVKREPNSENYWLVSNYPPHARNAAFAHAKQIEHDGYKAKVTRNKKTGYYHVWTSKQNPYTNPKRFGGVRRSSKVYTYHGRTGHPIVHQTKTGKEYIMVRAEGGGTKRLYLTRKTKQLLESEKGYPR